MRKKKKLGIGFADMVLLGTQKKWTEGKGKYKDIHELNDLQFASEEASFGESRFSPWRIVAVLIFAFMFTAVMLGRLFHLQIVKGQELRAQSDTNRLVARTIHAPRGIIYDRSGVQLVHNVPAFVKIEDGKAVLVPYEEALSLEATSSARQHLEVQAVRSYPEKEVLSHILGYTSEISQEELGQNKVAKSYTIGDRIGRDGIELTYDQYLHGQDGATQFEVNAVGQTLREVSETKAIEGHSLILHTDLALQKVAFESLKKAIEKLGVCCGAVVAQNPENGEILALVSFPSYDNNIFSGKLSQNQYEDLLKDQNRPLFNRAIAGEYPPGSLYKLITSAAGFKSNKLTEQTRIEDTGVITLGDFRFPNWLFLSQGRTEGVMDVVKAIKRSNDIFFYRVGEWVGPDYLAKTAKDFGLGKKTGIDLPGESTGMVPDIKWKKRVKNEPWYPGDTYHVAIGQGDNLETPMQLSMLTATVANNGAAFKPQLVSKVISQEGKVIKQFLPQKLYSDLLPAHDIALIREGMKEACEGNPPGTGWPFFDFGITQYEKLPEATQAAEVKKPIAVGCKTGTAEFGHPQNKTHAWFTVFAPFDDPEIALTVLIEAGGEGSNVSAPVAKEILAWYFANRGN